MTVRVITGDCRAVLATLDAGSVQCVVTSPPYYGLRDYGTATWVGGDAGCDHSVGGQVQDSKAPGAIVSGVRPGVDASRCRKCGARRVDSQIGLEASPDAYVAEMVAVFREVRRVLADSGTVWLNLGDSYAGTSVNRNGLGNSQIGSGPLGACKQRDIAAQTRQTVPPGYKPKDLLMIPARVALALQADGWWLRSDIIWAKPNPMPESVTDRCTSAHEHVFLLAKGSWRRRTVKLSDLSGERGHSGSRSRISDADAWAAEISIRLATAILDCPQIQQHLGCVSLQAQIGEQSSDTERCLPVSDLPSIERVSAYAAAGLLNADISAKEFLSQIHGLGLVLRDRHSFGIVGSDAKFPYPPGVDAYGKTSVAIHDAGKIGEFDFLHGHIVSHTATTCTYFWDAEAVAEPSEYPDDDRKARSAVTDKRMPSELVAGIRPGSATYPTRNLRNVLTIATQPYAGAHFATMPPALAEICIKAGSRPGDTVLDPFAGVGTTLLVADRLGRNGVGIELSPVHAMSARNRVYDDAPLFADVAD